jgi:hypothetical protein
MVALDITNASAQLPFDQQRDERSAPPIESTSRCKHRQRGPCQVRRDCLPGKTQQRVTLGFGQQHQIEP